MAEKPKPPAANFKQAPQVSQKTNSRFSLLLKLIAGVVALLILIGIGFAAGVYLKVIDVEKIANDMNLSTYPMIGGFFPKTNFEPVEIEDSAASDQPLEPSKSQSTQIRQQAPLLPVPQTTNPNIITKEDLEKQARLKQQEETKRISKLARLYGGMKPDEATAIMKELDDPTVIAIFSKMEEEQVSKILALFDSKRAARITEDMLKGQAQLPRL